MKLRQIFNFVENSKITQVIELALSSYYFPLVTAAVFVLSYYLGWEIVAIWYTCICGTAIMVCCKDVTPVLCLFLFLNIMSSRQHCPVHEGSDFVTDPTYFVRPAILAQEIIGVVFWAGSMIFRFVTGILSKRFKPNAVFWGLVALSVALMLSGIFYTHYVALNFLYGLGLAGIILFAYVLMSGNLEITEKTFTKVAYYFLILFAVASLELVVAYLTYDNLIVNGKVIRQLLFFGWGTYNQMGMTLILSIPAWFYLSCKFKYGVVFLIGGLFNVAMCFLSMSRQAMLMSGVMFVVCCVWVLIYDRGRKRLINSAVIAGVIAVLAILLGVFHKDVGQFFSSVTHNFFTGSGRTKLWKQGLDNFLRKPLFGIGFYDPLALPNEAGYMGEGLAYSTPYMCHNTFIQLMSSCGLLGLVTYVVHRAQTIISFINRPTKDRAFIIFTVLSLMLTCLLDNHIFYFFPTAVYAVLIAYLSVTEKKKESAKAALI